jgi:hypothetical protein
MDENFFFKVDVTPVYAAAAMFQAHVAADRFRHGGQA